MKELKENLEPLNARAKRYLRKVKAEIDPSSLYCLQLAQWGVEKGGLEIDYRVKESLPILMMEPPDLMMKRLEQPNPNDPEEVLNLLRGNNTPQDLAGSVLDRVRDLLAPSLGLNRDPTRD